MDLIELVLTICAVTQPNNCEERYLQFAWQGTLAQCTMSAQPVIAQWAGEHPKWQVTRYRCDSPGKQKA